VGPVYKTGKQWRNEGTGERGHPRDQDRKGEVTGMYLYIFRLYLNWPGGCKMRVG